MPKNHFEPVGKLMKPNCGLGLDFFEFIAKEPNTIWGYAK